MRLSYSWRGVGSSSGRSSSSLLLLSRRTFTLFLTTTTTTTTTTILGGIQPQRRRFVVSALLAVNNINPTKSSLQSNQQGFSRSTFGRSMSSSSSSSSNSNDEVAKAKAAAIAQKIAEVDDKEPTTIFDKLLSGEWKSDKVYEDDIAFAFKDISPQAPIHILVIPKKRNGLTQLSKATPTHSDVLGHLLYIAGQIGKEHCPNGYRIVINDGSDGAQSVYHLHLHVLGGRQLGWPPG